MSERVTGIIGLGRVGSTLALALRVAGVPIVVWDRHQGVRRQAGRKLGRGVVVASGVEVVRRSDVVLLALPDDVLPRLTLALPPRRRVVFAHLSGLRTSAVLLALRRAGHAIGSIHPLRSFPRRWERAPLRGTVFAIEGDVPAVPALRGIARRLGGRPVAVIAAEKPLYHAAAALAANHGIFLAHVAERWMVRAGLTPALARAGLSALMSSAVSSYAAAGARAGLTGPLSRADVAAIADHRRAIAWDRGGARAYAEMARQALGPGGVLSGLPARDRRRLRSALGSRPNPRGDPR